MGADRNKSLGLGYPEGGGGRDPIMSHMFFVYLGSVVCNYVVILSRRRLKRSAAILHK